MKRLLAIAYSKSIELQNEQIHFVLQVYQKHLNSFWIVGIILICIIV